MVDSGEGSILVQNASESSLITKVKEKKDSDLILLTLKEVVQSQKVKVLPRGKSVRRCQGNLCVPDVDDLRQRMLTEAHNSRYSTHP